MAWNIPHSPLTPTLRPEEYRENMESLSVKLSGGLDQDDFEHEGDGGEILIDRDIDLASGKVINVGNLPVPIFDAYAFGMAHDTPAQNSNALREALAAAGAETGGGIVWIPPGLWVIDSAEALAIPSGVVVRGAGPGTTVLQSVFRGSETDPEIRLDGHSGLSSVFGPTLENLSLTCDRSVAPEDRRQVGVVVTGANCQVRNCTVTRYGKTQIRLQNAYYANISGVRAAMMEKNEDNEWYDGSVGIDVLGRGNNIVGCVVTQVAYGIDGSGGLGNRAIACHGTDCDIVLRAETSFSHGAISGCSFGGNSTDTSPKLTAYCVGTSIVGNSFYGRGLNASIFALRSRIIGNSFTSVPVDWNVPSLHVQSNSPELDADSPILVGNSCVGTLQYAGYFIPEQPSRTDDSNWWADVQEF
ncbi:MAG: hypothetical protein GF355_09560 [Candidatus Eisenbacteria bacterium]|nr:hypothetical protein [Candidatus Eisenbacteria bacterium]